MVAAHVGSVACMLCIALASPPWAVGGIFVYQILCGMSSPGAFAMSQILAGPGASGRWVGIQNAVGNLAGVIAPALTGLLVEETHHFTAAFLVAAMVSVLGLAGWVWMVPRLAPSLVHTRGCCRRAAAHPAASVRSTAPVSFPMSSASSASRALYGGATMMVSPSTPPTWPAHG